MYDFHSSVVEEVLFYVFSHVVKGDIWFPPKDKLNIVPSICHVLFERDFSGSRHIQI